VTASPRDGRGTAEGGPRGQQERKRRPPQPAQLGCTTRTPDGMGNRTGPHRAQPPGIYTAGRAQRPAKLPPAVPPAALGEKPPHNCTGRSRACAAFAAQWVPRGSPSTPSCPPARIGRPKPLATVRAAGSITPNRARVSGVSPTPFAGAGQGVMLSRPFARRYATP